MLEYQDFLTMVKEEISDYLSEEYMDADIRIQQVQKNNGVILDGLTILLKDQSMGPCIYLNGFYEDYKSGSSVEDILFDISSICENRKGPDKAKSAEVMDFEKIKHKIIFEVTSEKENHDRLKDLPHRTENDLALIYRIYLEETEGNVFSLVIQNPLLAIWKGVSEQDLYDLAKVNTPSILPPMFCPMKEILFEMMVSDLTGKDPASLSEEERQGYEQMFRSMGLDNPEGNTMYVLSNTQKTKGASSLFYPNMREEIAEKLGENYYVLPSSLHECIIYPASGNISIKDLKQMVTSANESVVSREEVLSGEVYYYDKNAKALTIAGERKPSLASQLENAKAKQAEKGAEEQAAGKEGKAPGYDR